MVAWFFGGHRNEKGEIVDSGGSLSFDKYGHLQQCLRCQGVFRAQDGTNSEELFR